MSYGGEIQEYEGPGGEILQASEVTMDALGSLTRAEIDSQIATARRYPRSIKKFMDDARSLACLNPEVAASCIYALPRAGKAIEGPSVRLAEIVAHTFGNLRVSARITQETDRYLVAQATAVDLEKNNGVQIEVRRGICDRNGRKYKDDMVNVTANAALSIAYRNAIWKCVPAAFVSPIYREARKLAAGGGKSIEERRKNVQDWIASLGVKSAELFSFLVVKGWEDIGLEHMAILAGIMTSIRDGETTVEEVFRPRSEHALPAPSRTDRLAAELGAKAGIAPVPDPAEWPVVEAPTVAPDASAGKQEPLASPRRGKGSDAGQGFFPK